MKNKQDITELYLNLVEGMLKYKDKKLQEQYKNVCKHMEQYYTDVKVLVVNTKRPKGVEKLITVLITELKKNNIKYMEAVKSEKYIWIAYRIEKN